MKIKKDPTPKQIEKRAKRIRDGWDERTRCIRSGFSPDYIDNSRDNSRDDILKFVRLDDLMAALRDKNTQFFDFEG
jgi:hypothetical protein